MTTTVLLNFDNGLIEEAQGRTLTATNSGVSDVQAKFGTHSLLATDPIGKILIGGTVPLREFFTIELWFYVTSHVAMTRSFVGPEGNQLDHLSLNSNNRLQTQFVNAAYEGTTEVQIGLWNHAALVNNGGSLALYLNGYKEAVVSTLVTRLGEQLRIGGNHVAVNDMTGVYVDGFRVIEDHALYTQNFAPPTVPPTVEHPLFNQFDLATMVDTGLIMPMNPGTVLLGRSITLPFSPMTTVLASPIQFLYDPNRGSYTITGTVKERGTPNAPLYRKVVLLNEHSGRIVREAVSDPVTGAYVFTDLPLGRYTALSKDPTGYHRAVIADNLEPT